MGPSEVEWVLALLRAAPPPETVPDFDALQGALALHNLNAACGVWLARQPLAQARVPEPFRRACSDASAASDLRAQVVLREARRCSLALAAAGVPHRFFKGAALVAAGIHAPGERQLADADLAVPPAQVELALEAFAACGYRPPSATELRVAEWSGEATVRPDPPGDSLKPPFDLHLAFDYGLFSGFRPGASPLLTEALLARPAGQAGGLPVPDPSAHLFTLLLHLISHFSRRFRGKWLADIHALLARETVDGAWVAASLRAAGVHGIAAALLEGLRLEVGTAVPPELTAGARPLPGRWFLPSRLFRMEGVHESAVARMAARVLLDDRPLAALRLASRALWPSDAWVRVHFPAASPPVRVRLARLGDLALAAAGMRALRPWRGTRRERSTG